MNERSWMIRLLVVSLVLLSLGGSFTCTASSGDNDPPPPPPPPGTPR
jgi:hypothetical protein